MYFCVLKDILHSICCVRVASPSSGQHRLKHGRNTLINYSAGGEDMLCVTNTNSHQTSSERNGRPETHNLLLRWFNNPPHKTASFILQNDYL